MLFYFRFYFYSTSFGAFCCWHSVFGCECVPVIRRTNKTAAGNERRKFSLGNALRFALIVIPLSLSHALFVRPLCGAYGSLRLSPRRSSVRSRCNVYGRDALRAAQHSSCESVVAEIACPLLLCENRNTCMTFHSFSEAYFAL